MPRYFFHVEDHNRFPDEDGTVLADLAEARVEAVLVAGAMLREHASEFWNTGEWRVVVTDAKQLILFTLRFEAVAAPIPPRAYDRNARDPNQNAESKGS